MISWIYLRFYQMHANGSRGDTADGFAFASFFPNVIQPPVAVFGNTIFSLLGKSLLGKMVAFPLNPRFLYIDNIGY